MSGFDLNTETGRTELCEYGAKLIADFGDKNGGWRNIENAFDLGITFAEWYPITLRKFLEQPKLCELFDTFIGWGITKEQFMRAIFEEFRRRVSN